MSTACATSTRARAGRSNGTAARSARRFISARPVSEVSTVETIEERCGRDVCKSYFTQQVFDFTALDSHELFVVYLAVLVLAVPPDRVPESTEQGPDHRDDDAAAWSKHANCLSQRVFTLRNMIDTGNERYSIKT